MDTSTDRRRFFCTAWSNLDAAELGAFFTADATYRNIPIPGVHSGREAIQEALAGQITDHDVDLPIVGVFQLTPDFRHFTSWVDYFDLAQSEFDTVG